MTKITAKYGLPAKVSFCRKCVMSNQKPSSTVEFKYASGDKKKTIAFDAAGVCDACHFAEYKETQIDWKKREKQLRELCDRYRRTDSSYDCIVPGSGGKDSAFAYHVLKYKYDMHPLTVTWAPHLYTDIGWRNFTAWIHQGGFDNVLFTPNGRVHRLLTRLAFKNLLHPFQPFIFGQKNIGAKFALKFNVPLVFYGENQEKYDNGKSPKENDIAQVRPEFFSSDESIDTIILGGVPVKKLLAKEGLSRNDLDPYLPVSARALKKQKVQVHYLAHYLKWDPQENFYYATKHTGFQANTERTEGSYSKYSSIDDKTDPFHYYTTLIKFGIGRATYDAAQEIRNRKITRAEGVALVRRYDQEFPERSFKDFLEYIDISKEEFWRIIDRARSPHIWKKEKGRWVLRHPIE